MIVESLLPWPMMRLTSTGEVLASASLSELLEMESPTPERLSERFEVSRLGSRAVLPEKELPWRRALRGESFSDEEVWYDQQTARRLLLLVRCRAAAGEALLAFENVADEPFAIRLADLVASIGAALLSADEPSALAHGLLDEVAAAVRSDAVFLIATEGGERLRLVASVGVPAAFAQDYNLNLATTVAGLAAETGDIQEIARIEDLPEGTFRGTLRLLELGLHAVSAFPLNAGGELVGVLGLARRQPGKLSPIERRLLRGVAGACALGLRQARQRDAERREARRLRLLRDVAMAIEAAIPLRELLRRLVEQACELTRARYGALGVLDAKGTGLSDFVYVGVSEKVARDIGSLPEGRGLLRALINEPRPSRVADIHADPRSVGFPAHHPAMTSFLGVPLLIGQKVFGNFYLCDKDGGVEFTEEDERMVRLFAAQSALAIAYAQQFESTQEAHREMDRLRDEFAAVIAHDLRNPVAAMTLILDALLAKPENDSVVVSVQQLQRLRRIGSRISRMTQDLLDVSRIELRRLSLDRLPVSLEEATRSLLAEIEPTLGQHPVTLHVEDCVPEVFVDPARLAQILTNLLDNAAKYSGAGAPIRVTIRPEAGGAGLSVEDRGPGISAADLGRLFDRFSQAQRAREKNTGLGLGLYITKGLMEAHGGTIAVESAQGQGSTFRLWFPAAPSAQAA
ncbi:sensor histidine kinase [Polyangium jinanense]|uniref:histidine kinase n=1 Tax=Polyangium jinanense TaxID=2829994 RepID=A0A9X4ARF3_9BACT|nr:GAF domain-containing sensor histidine kinase [Polyangium jinanense]MDC3953986.1 GAF domain-containing protein [Polyangium jinanense]MDC3957801.1 GAF domain-containing protein [Polyangium jinanense]MDC3978887.1 GAF domain-containing protein [Polyangium jinanense]MDC3982058.1 GAF domain-containing protein [Polyangium jinanense]